MARDARQLAPGRIRIHVPGAGEPVGSATFPVGQLKTIQVILELAVFTGFVRLYMKQAITWNYVGAGFFFLFLGAFFVFRKF